MASKEIIDSLAEAIAEAWSTLFMKKIGLEAGELQASTELSDLAGEYVTTSIVFEGDINGESKLFIPKLEALTMVGMMMSMGSDDAMIESTREGDLGDEQLDALNEAFNQLSATSATVLRDKKDCSVNASAKPSDKVDLEGALPDASEEDQATLYTLELEGYDNGSVAQTFSASLMESLDGESEEQDDAMDALASLGLDSDDAESSALEESEETPSEDSDPSVDLLLSKGHLKIKADAILAERSMEVSQLLALGIGSVIEFWKPCDDPAELSLGNSPVASGEVVVSQDQHFCLRIVELAPEKRTYQKGIV
jgi:flagellar motor switch/type III secretory pathway protein FliN